MPALEIDLDYIFSDYDPEHQKELAPLPAEVPASWISIHRALHPWQKTQISNLARAMISHNSQTEILK